MKKILLLSAALAFLVACGHKTKSKTETLPHADRIEVLSFHGKQRCATCLAIEKLTRELLESEYAARLADSSLVLRIVDIAENETLADRYEVTWSSLLLNKWKDGKETANNLTEFAFAHARNNPEAFKAGLKTEIDKLLAQ